MFHAVDGYLHELNAIYVCSERGFDISVRVWLGGRLLSIRVQFWP